MKYFEKVAISKNLLQRAGKAAISTSKELEIMAKESPHWIKETMKDGFLFKEMSDLVPKHVAKLVKGKTAVWGPTEIRNLAKVKRIQAEKFLNK